MQMRASALRELHHNADPLMSESDAQSLPSIPVSLETAGEPAPQPDTKTPEDHARLGI
jgi:hypothetical protein